MMSFVDEQASAWLEIHQLYKDSTFFAKPLETPDGPGATVESTGRLREWLPGILTKYRIATMLDAACGDFNWMRHVDLGIVDYTGWDVDAGRIERCWTNLDESASDPTTWQRGLRRFECVNLLAAPDLVPHFDLILCRHFLQHLPTNDLVDFVLTKFQLSLSPYLLVTTFPGADNDFQWDPHGSDHAWRGYFERPYDLLAPPFNLGEPLEVFTENLGPGGILTVPHDLALFKLGA
jgi:hypothetical protein